MWSTSVPFLCPILIKVKEESEKAGLKLNIQEGGRRGDQDGEHM